jgi:TolA-binding protein
MNNTSKNIRPLLVIAALLMVFSQTACMKTRSQIKGDPSESAEATVNPRPGSTAAYEMEEVKSELTRISGKLEEVEHAQQLQNTSEVKEYASRLDARIAELEKNQMLLLSEVKALKDKEAQVVAREKEAAVPASDLLSEASSLLAQKHYEEATEKYKAVLNKGAKGKDGAEALFGLGECEFGQKNFKKAIVHYSKVQEVFAKSPRVPASLYKIGLSFERLNMPKEAKGFFNELNERFPKSAEAKRARSKVKE